MRSDTTHAIGELQTAHRLLDQIDDTLKRIEKQQAKAKRPLRVTIHAVDNQEAIEIEPHLMLDALKAQRELYAANVQMHAKTVAEMTGVIETMASGKLSFSDNEPF